MKGMMHELMKYCRIKNFTSSVPFLTMCECNLKGWKQCREVAKIHILYQATIYISGCLTASLHLSKAKMQHGGTRAVRRGRHDSHLVHKFLI